MEPQYSCIDVLSALEVFDYSTAKAKATEFMLSRSHITAPELARVLHDCSVPVAIADDVMSFVTNSSPTGSSVTSTMHPEFKAEPVAEVPIVRLNF